MNFLNPNEKYRFVLTVIDNETGEYYDSHRWCDIDMLVNYLLTFKI